MGVVVIVYILANPRSELFLQLSSVTSGIRGSPGAANVMSTH